MSSAPKNDSPDQGAPVRRSNRLNSKGRTPSASLIAAKKAAIERAKKAQTYVVNIRDIYQLAEDAKAMVNKPTGVVYDKRMVEHHCLWDENYPECPDRFTYVLSRCQEMGLLSRCKQIQSREASEEEVLKKHSPKQIELLRATENSQNFEELEDISSHYDAIYIHPSTYRLSLLAAGSTIDLVEAVCKNEIQNGMAIIRPPGHHAMKSEYCGYCFFNNVALAAQHALDNLGVSKILIVDWDVHHGQATQQMFFDDNRVVYFSIHRYEHGTFWPNLRESDFDYIGTGAGRGYNFNVPLNKTGMTNTDYLAIFHQLLLPLASEFQPELIIVSSGYDAALGCFEGEMEITPACYAHLVNSLSAFAHGKIAVILEGGYCLKSLAEGAALTLRSLLGDPVPMIESLGQPCDSIIETILNVIYTHQDYWQCYQFTEKYKLNEKSELPPTVKKHVPIAPFKFEGEAKLEKYETRNCYPVQSNETKELIKKRLDDLIYRTQLLAPKPVCFVYDEIMLRHQNPYDGNHPEKPARLSSIFEKHSEYGLLERLHILKSRVATKEELLLVHKEEHIDAMEQLSELTDSELKSKADGFDSIYFNKFSYEAATVAAGSLLQVVDSVLNGDSRAGVAVVRPPGHHAEVEEPCGFCLFNSASVAAKYAIEMHGLKRVLLLDWDVHHGNGSQEIFEADPQVLYISLHRYDNGSFFPHSTDAAHTVVGEGKGRGFNVNIPWNKRGIGNAEYIAAFHQIVLPIAYQFNPELIIVSAGFDAAIGDPLGGYKVTPEAYGHFTHWLSSLANGRVILTLEGGYNVRTISYAMTMCTKALLHDPIPILDPLTPINPSAIQSIKQVISVQSEFWSALQFLVAIPSDKVLEGKPDELISMMGDLSLKLGDYANEVTKSYDEKDFGNLSWNCDKNSSNGDDCKVTGISLNNNRHVTPSSVCISSNVSTPDSLKSDSLNPCFTSNCSDSSIVSTPNYLQCDPSTLNFSSVSSLTPNSVKSDCSNFNSSSSSVASQGLSTPNFIKSDQLGNNSFESSSNYLSCDSSFQVVSPGLSIMNMNNDSPKNSNQKFTMDDGAGCSSSSASSSQKPENIQTLSDYLAENMELLVGGEMFAVVPKKNCPHLSLVRKVPETGVNTKVPCATCSSTAENWSCLTCYTVQCGRYIKGHMAEHSTKEGHPVVLSFSDLSVWCYGCEAYLDNEVLYEARNAAHQDKFGSALPWSYGPKASS
ncbi:histone deacetylase 6 isoform X2 [Bemisia tabaci]|uniref:histone deacetylase 6 isoform X2 n=1 Tax=Bemisia tabaci TaxID=7038 RepID=UPI003B2837D0